MPARAQDARALELLVRFSVELTQTFDHAIGTDYADNREVRTLLTIMRDAPISTRQCADRSGVSRRALNRLLLRLETADIIERARAPHDQRVRQVHLTAHGRRRTAKLERQLGLYLASSCPLAIEIVDALGSSRPTSTPPFGTLDAVDRIAAVGTALQQTIAATHTGPSPASRQHLALLLADTLEAPVRPKALAGLLQITTGGITYVLDQLEDAGLIERHHGQDPTDRRAITITLTRAGVESVAATHAAIDEHRTELANVFASIACDNGQRSSTPAA